MIATMLKSSSTFSAVEYNERKVSKGTAELLEIHNFDMLKRTGNINCKSLRKYLIQYSSRNENIKNAQFHLAISCKKNEYNYDELVKIAHQYLKKMGYEEEGQPILIYAHHDTHNNHIHIVTSRVAPNGKKINHNNERLRSQAVLNEIMGVQPKQDVKKVIQNSLAYSFTTTGQFQAILESCGYESYVEEEKLNIKKGGTVLKTILIANIEKEFKSKTKDETKKRRDQLKAILLKYKRLTENKDELCRVIKKKFGISLIFVGSKDKPYGYMVVDHKEKAVYKGSEVLTMKELLEFSQKSTTKLNQDKTAILTFIHQNLQTNKTVTTRDVNEQLWHKFGVYITHEGFVKDKRHTSMVKVDEQDMDILRLNNKKQWIQGFCPTTEEERTVLCSFAHIVNHHDISIATNKNVDKQNIFIGHLREMLNKSDKKQIVENLRNNKIIIYQKENALFAIDLNNAIIANLRETNLDLTMLWNLNRSQSFQKDITLQNPQQSPLLNDVLHSSHSGHHSNREWEVGGNGSWDDVDDERKLKR